MKNSRKFQVTEFKRKCLELIRSEQLQSSPIELMKHGKVVAIVCTPEYMEKSKPLKGSVTYKLKDIISINQSKDWELA